MRGLIVGLALIGAFACGDGSPGRVVGEVLAGPTCPVEREGEPCDPKPLVGAAVIVTDEDGSDVAETTTGPLGRFEITIRPGTWQVTARSDEAMSCEGIEVIVTAGGETEITIPCDTGIR